ncbi:MAG TPA: flagellar biosynthesis anti-sigma factor FlgM [Thauera sp.]|jgi:negative regulator of flagellin synthesis FlgM|nr:flagellar biosynthesis anti-sigma factor FlgM [Thauera sp.]HRA80710.1 flagellar biosynthesis anti-sigma factor FlgM [Thauera sp.]
MKIESSSKPVATAATEPRSRPASSANTPSTNSISASSGDKVQLSSLSASLQKAEAAIAEAPVVDTQRVEEIKAAIANGEFKIDADRIAEGLISSVREMLAGSRQS